MKQIKKLSLEQFRKKCEGRTHVTCGINFVDGTHVTVQCAPYSYVEYVINSANKEVEYVAIC